MDTRVLLELLAHVLLWIILRNMVHDEGETYSVLNYRRYTSWNLTIFGLCMCELLWRRGQHSFLAAFSIVNSIAVNTAFYAGTLTMDLENLVQWARIELKDLATPRVDSTTPQELMLAAVNSSQTWTSYVTNTMQVASLELTDGINHHLEYAAVFHIGAFVQHAVPAFIAWRYWRSSVTVTMPWWLFGLVSSGFHMAWALSVNGSLILSDIYFPVPDIVWCFSWIAGSIAHMLTAYFVLGGSTRMTKPQSNSPRGRGSSKASKSKGSSNAPARQRSPRTAARSIFGLF
eukprot:TRINITY_DN22490_c0_g3_i1.p1 TRINITY_DN22490_c0_g3~~TRINITY_DN22490_c0_g3_i1.p1  ORF type:complete len:303 (-),score=22.20 TRINITY_DN22490_c0_g3_i1:99-962(-)